MVSFDCKVNKFNFFNLAFVAGLSLTLPPNKSLLNRM
jgi:hypothetical protein